MLTTRLSRELVYSSRGIVCSNSPLAASAGIRVMQEGGNAFDAALAVAAAEAVTLVPFCGMGGDSFILLYQASSGKVTEINSSGVAATGATAEYYRSLGYQTMPLEGPQSISVPDDGRCRDHGRYRIPSQIKNISIPRQIPKTGVVSFTKSLNPVFEN